MLVWTWIHVCSWIQPIILADVLLQDLRNRLLGFAKSNSFCMINAPHRPSRGLSHTAQCSLCSCDIDFELAIHRYTIPYWHSQLTINCKALTWSWFEFLRESETTKRANSSPQSYPLWSVHLVKKGIVTPHTCRCKWGGSCGRSEPTESVLVESSRMDFLIPKSLTSKSLDVKSCDHVFYLTYDFVRLYTQTHSLHLASAGGPLQGSKLQNNRKTFSVINALLFLPVTPILNHVLNLLEIIDFVSTSESEKGRERERGGGGGVRRRRDDWGGRPTDRERGN